MLRSKIKSQNVIKNFKFCTAILTFAFCLLNFNIANAALLYSGAANEVTYQNHTFVIEWYLDTQGQNVNSVNLKLRFTKDTLQVLNAEAGNSDLNLWVKTPEFDNKEGTLQLIGGVAGGLNISKLRVFRTTFKPIALGPAQIYADDSSSVFLNDGVGTELKLSFMRLSFPVVEGTSTGVAVSSNTHPDETMWYKNNSVELEVFPKVGEIYSFSFSSNIEMVPDDKEDDVSKKFNFDNLVDGIYYFKLLSKTGNGNWQEVLVRRFQIDATPPEAFAIKPASDPGVLNGEPFISFATNDKTSGIENYQIRFGPIGLWNSTKQTYYVIPRLHLSDQVQVKATDLAGNEQVAQMVLKLPNKGVNFAKWILWIIIIISVFLVVRFIRFVIKRTTFKIRNEK